MGDVLDIQTVVSVLIKELSLQKQQIENLTRANAELKRENAELRERLFRYEHPKNSRNSNLPPTKDSIGKKKNINLREKSERKSGGQAGHAGKHLEMQIPDEVEILSPCYLVIAVATCRI